MKPFTNFLVSVESSMTPDLRRHIGPWILRFDFLLFFLLPRTPRLLDFFHIMIIIFLVSRLFSLEHEK
jgi:hypothetical protein